jgi:hypothetical protein
MEAVAVGVLQMESVHTGLKRQALKIERTPPVRAVFPGRGPVGMLCS